MGAHHGAPASSINCRLVRWLQRITYLICAHAGQAETIVTFISAHATFTYDEKCFVLNRYQFIQHSRNNCHKEHLL